MPLFCWLISILYLVPSPVKCWMFWATTFPVWHTLRTRTNCCGSEIAVLLLRTRIFGQDPRTENFRIRTSLTHTTTICHLFKHDGHQKITKSGLLLTYTNAAVESITTGDEWSLNAVVKKHPNVSAANTVSVNANMVLALAKKVFIFTYIRVDQI